MSPRPRHPRPRRVAAAALAASALVATAALTAAPAQSAPDPGCPDAFPVGDLSTGDTVNGLTVTSGTTPGPFTGTIEGVLEDGISPGVDMILADLHSTTIDDVGIWSGISGSPVYAGDGRLIGSVSYSLGLGPSTIAGITPATEMAKLLTGVTPPVRTAPHVAVPRALRARMVASGAATAAQAAGGLSAIRTPVGVSGLTAQRLATLTKVLHLGGGHVVDGSAGPTSDEAIPIQAGGNLAASLSYGTVTAAAVGTATLVCGDQVVGFGHPFAYSGPASMSLHGARAVLIQDDQTVSGFKVANLGAPIGTVDQDRLVGIHGVTGALPPSIPVTATALQHGVRRHATTHVTQADLLPDLGFSNTIAAQDRVIDRIGKGTAWAEWTIKGLRKDGSRFSLKRSDVYTDSYDVSAAPAFAMADQIAEIQGNPGEAVRLTSVDSRTHFYDYSDTYVISKVQARQDGRWTTLRRSAPVFLKAGRTARLKVLATSRDAATRTFFVNVAIPARAAGRIGSLSVVGGNDDGDSEYYFDEFDGFGGPEAPSSSTLPALLHSLRTAQQHNEVRATVRFRHFRNGNPVSTRRGSTTLLRVVGGSVSAPVVALP